MQTREFWSLANVTDVELEAALKDLLRAGAKTEARVVAHLAEMDARRLTLLGGQSLFEYCQLRLGFSESEAWYRICAARTARRFPMVFELLERRELHLTAIALVAKYLTEENHLELLAEVRGKTKRQILELLVCRFPKADVSSVLRRLPIRASAMPVGPTGSLEPLSPHKYCLQLMTSSVLKDKLELARDLTSHANPNGDLAVVVERAVDLLLQKLQARRFGRPKRLAKAAGLMQGAPQAGDGPFVEQSVEQEQAPAEERSAHRVGELATVAAPASDPTNRGSSGGERSRERRHISNEVRRQVVARDDICCSYIAPNGERCRATAFLEFDHKVAWAKGGSDSLQNLRVLCRMHNQFLAEREFGAVAIRRARTLAPRP